VWEGRKVIKRNIDVLVLFVLVFSVAFFVGYVVWRSGDLPYHIDYNGHRYDYVLSHGKPGPLTHSPQCKCPVDFTYFTNRNGHEFMYCTHLDKRGPEVHTLTCPTCHPVPTSPEKP
jgi:hypothetical protein